MQAAEHLLNNTKPQLETFEVIKNELNSFLMNRVTHKE